MNGEQKRAWLMVISSGLCLIAFAILTPIVGPRHATAALAFYGLNGLRASIGRRETSDERDRSIVRRATLVGGMASYLAFVLALMGTWTVCHLLRGQEQIPILVLPVIVLLCASVFLLVRGVALLVLYRRHTEADDV